MKGSLLLLLTFSALGLTNATQAQPLEPGQTYLFEFTSVPFVTRTTTPILGNAASMFFEMIPDNPFDNEFRVELFENNPSETPICRLDVDASWDAFDINCLLPDAWQDLQGVARVSMLSGTAPLSFYSNLQIFVPSGAGDFLRYEQSDIKFVAVPEPSALTWLGAGVVWFFWRTRNLTRHRLRPGENLAFGVGSTKRRNESSKLK